MGSRLSEKEREEKKELMKGISNNNQTMWIGIIIAILFFWSGVGLNLGLIIALIGYESKKGKERELVDLE